MSRRDNGIYRCRDCALHLSLCLCDEVPDIAVATRLYLVMHRDETRKPTNTGRLALRSLRGSKLLVHGRSGERLQAPWHQSPSDQSSRKLVLFPCEEAEELTAQHASSGPISLIVPDGTWRQAAKLARRIDWIQELPRVCLPKGEDTRYQLRAEPKQDGLATMEAIAQAFGILEGAQVQESLEQVFRKMVDRTLYSRGQLGREHVYGGLPDEAMRHDPRREGATGGWK